MYKLKISDKDRRVIINQMFSTVEDLSRKDIKEKVEYYLKNIKKVI